MKHTNLEDDLKETLLDNLYVNDADIKLSPYGKILGIVAEHRKEYTRNARIRTEVLEDDDSIGDYLKLKLAEELCGANQELYQLIVFNEFPDEKEPMTTIIEGSLSFYI